MDFDPQDGLTSPFRYDGGVSRNALLDATIQAEERRKGKLKPRLGEPLPEEQIQNQLWQILQNIWYDGPGRPTDKNWQYRNERVMSSRG